jgi:hypothetical protein
MIILILIVVIIMMMTIIVIIITGTSFMITINTLSSASPDLESGRCH